MDLAREGALRGDPEGTVYGTDYQSQGRGRFADRKWLTPPGCALTFTLLVRPPFPGFPLSLRSALGVALWLEALGLTPKIKWPNDVLVKDRKISGILVESTQNYAGIGIGINILQAPPSAHLRTPATFLAEHIDNVAPPRNHLEALLGYLNHSLTCADAREQTEARLAWRGNWLEILEGEGTKCCRAHVRGVDDSGGLIYEAEGQIRTLVSGEVRRPV